MKRQFLISMSVLFFLSGIAGAVDLQWSGVPNPQHNASTAYKQNELIVRFADPDTGSQLPEGPVLTGPLTRRAIRSRISDFIVAGAAVDKEYDDSSPGLAVVKLPEGTSVLDAGIKFLQSANVLYAEPNYKYRLFATYPSDLFFTDLWGLDNTGQKGGTEDADIDAPEAWDITTGSSDIIVAVIDAGIDYMHPDLAANIWVNVAEQGGTPGVDDDNNGYIDDIYGYDFAGASSIRANDGKSDPKDAWFHGTHVAGIIGAIGNNTQGVAGVCWNVKMMALKIYADDFYTFETRPEAFASDAIVAIQYAIDNGADIINASWGGEYDSQSLREAIAKAGDAGILFVAAAGNDYGSDNDETAVYPASYDLDNIISVMSTDANDMMSRFSNFGATSVDIAAPGTDIVSTTPTIGTFPMTVFFGGISTNYDTLSGTSASTAYVSGACALLKSHYPALPKEVIKGLLMKTVDPVLTTPMRCLSGGRLNLYNALTLIPSGKPGKAINSKNPQQLYNTIQAAIDEAEDGDELIAEANSLFFEGINFKGKAITLRSGDINEPANTNISPENTVILGMLSDGSTVTFANNEGPNTILKGLTISRGETDYGGGITCDGASPTITDCIISNNIAKYYGAGIDCTNGSSPIIKNCTITGNQTSESEAIGGGINIEDSSPKIENCVISYNFADNVGGGIACYNSNPTIFNCLITNNSAVYIGGGIELENSSPVITNCTIIVDDPNAPKDGGIFASEDSSPVITNCIIWGNGDDLFNCSARYSSIEDNDQGTGNIHIKPTFVTGPLGDYYLSQTAAGQLTDSTCIDLGDPATDPGLQLNTYTTRTDGQTDAGIADMGFHYPSIPAKILQLNITVAGDGTVEPGSGTYRQYEVVQLKADPNEGYRIKSWTGTEDDSSLKPDKTITMIADTDISIEFELIPLHQLTTIVDGGHGDIKPSHRRGAYYPEGTVVTLIADPETTYGIDKWTGTDDDTSWSTENTVTIDSDKVVKVKFRQPKSFSVPGHYPTIGDAINAAYDHGDKVIVSAGTYPGGYDFQGKAITVASEHPDDPASVAATIIDCAGRSRAFMFQSGEGHDSVLDGFTIINGSGVANPNNPPNTGGTGGKGADALGGTITCLNGASPTLSNLIIRNSNAWGQNGENGSFIYPPPPPAPPAPDPLDPNAPFPAYPDIDPNDPNSYDPNNVVEWDPNNPDIPTVIDGSDGEPGADGLDGEPGADGAPGAAGYKGGDGGLGYGGAMYFDANCAPIILHCTIVDCNAIGGNGGYGGRGQAGQDGQDGQGGQAGQDGQAGQTGYDGGQDGAGGNGGNGGAGGPGGRGGDGGAGGDGGSGAEALGGAIYFGPDCRPTIRYCTILNCMTNQGIGSRGGLAGSGGAGGGAGGSGGAGGAGGDGNPAGAPGTDNTGTASGGDGGNGASGGNASPDGARTWAGAIYFGENCEVDISDTIIANNATTTIPRIDPFDPNAPGYDPNAFGPGTGGAPGTDGAAGAPGSAGSSADPGFVTTFGGGNYYEPGVKVKMTNCIIAYNTSERHDGGGEFYSEGSTVIFNQSDFIGNSARYGGGQFYDPCCSIEAKDCEYTGNSATRDGGGLFIRYDCALDIDNSKFNSNLVLGSGGGIYGGGEFDFEESLWYNNSTINIEDTEFYRNLAGFGGGIYWHGEDSEVTVSYSKFDDNTADAGGGLYFSRGAPKIIGCTITNNDADDTVTVDPTALYGGGGGIFCWLSDARIEDCLINNNSSSGSGGGVYLGGESAPLLKNCLINRNSASIDGGGVVANWFVEPTIANCTIIDNQAFDFGDSGRGKGGGLSCTYESKTTLINSILWNNKSVFGNQIAIGSDNEPIYLNRPAALTVSYSDIQGGRAAEAIHVEPGRTLNWLIGNINADPIFTGLNYLSQTQAGQSADSPCVDSGSDLAGNLGMNLYTTRTDRVADAGVVDIGYHSIIRGQEQELILVVVGPGKVEADIDPSKTEDNDDNQTSTYTFITYRGDVVTFIAAPNEGYRVKSWSGTDKYPSWNTNTNTLTVDGSEYVRIEFEPDITRNLLVPTQYRTIEDAIGIADQYGTNIIVNRGVHTVSDPNGIDFQGKNITLMSANPNDPNVVAETIIDCRGSSSNMRRAFWFHSGEDHNTKVIGFTIRNGYMVGAVGISGGIPGHYYDPTDDTTPFIQASGTYATGTATGGAILCENASSPTIQNCVITDCTVVGAVGGGGISGTYRPAGSSDDGEWGGDGGNAEGYSFGGAIACFGGSNPIISNCTITNNTAIGAIGGNGGNGSFNLGNGLASHGGNGGSVFGEGFGGGIYCEDKSTPVITNCIFSNNVASSGLPGAEGDLGGGSPLEDETPPYPMAADGVAGATGGVGYGGAAYFRSADPTFVDCTFSGNQAYSDLQNLVSAQVVFGVGLVRTYVVGSAWTRGGALYSGSDNTVVLKNCLFAGNLGGAVYCNPNNVLNVNDCSFKENINTIDGGAIFAGSGSYVDVADSTFVENAAYSGGGALNCKTNANFKNCLFRENEAGNNGGAIDAYYDTGNPEIREILKLNFESCRFGGNKATQGSDGWGGGVHFHNFDATFNDCSFVDNEARGGGGLFLTGGTVILSGGIISGNRSIGGDDLDIGGGLACVVTNATIENCTIRDNIARGVNGAGGAISFYSGPVKHLLRNCLITGNSATVYGGAISCSSYAKPEIKNCTFSDNWARSLGGAIFSDWSSDPIISDSIFQNCDSHAIAEEHYGKAIVKHCLFNGNSGGDYGRLDTVTQLIETISGGDFDNTNIEGDPLYADGPLGGFYLSQAASGQDTDSPAVNAGSGSASDLGLSDYTTRTDGSEDAGIVDIGYHERIPSAIPQFKLAVSVAGGHGTVNPDSATAYKGRSDNVVTVTARPEAGYKVRKWTGTDDDFPYGLTKTVTLLSNKTVTVEFEQAQTIHVPDQYHSISAAFNATGPYGNPLVTDGDKIIVSTGTYYEYNLDFAGRSITIASERPDDPACVAGTIIDCAITPPVGYPVIIGGGRAFIFRGGEGPDAVIDGFTIINGDAVGYSESHASPDQGYPVGGDGQDGFGGAIAGFGPSSPTISNCIIKNCMARGRYAGDGLDRTPQPIDDGPGGAGGVGGIGYGGAMYFAAGSKPTIVSCKIINCQAIGGKGGRGYHGKGTDMPGGAAGNGGEAYGGAMYFEIGCKPTIKNCIIEGCSSTTGEGNVGGNGTGNAPGGWGGVNGAQVWAGAIFCRENCDITILDTTISHSLVTTEIQRIWSGGLNGNGTLAPSGFSMTSTYGGANYYASGCRVELTRSTINDSKVESDSLIQYDGHGGAEYYLSNCDTKITDCAFANNRAGKNSYADGGGLAFGSNCSVDIVNSNLTGNTAGGEYSSGGAIYWDESWRVRIKDSYFTNSKAAFGGGLYWYGIGSEVFISDCFIYGNTADHGGGFYWRNGAARITGCDIIGNNSEGRFISSSNESLYGGGGGIFSWLSNATIEHSFISGNVTAGSGGGVYFGGGAGSPVLKNCLLTKNSALLEGGGVASYWSVKPTISNCTIADNIAHNPKNNEHGRGGGLSSSYDSETKLIDSILWGNKGDHGNQIAIGSSNNPDLIQRPAELWVSYCNIEGGMAAVSNEYGRTIHWGDPGDPGSNPIEVDPLFVTGPFGGYYLSQVSPAGDQAIDSPAVNAGSNLASILGLDTYATGTKGIPDKEKVDMGYHYSSHSTIPQYKLTIGVAGGQGTIKVSSPEPLAYDPADGTYTFYAGTIVTITANPGGAWRIISWSGGTANDGSKANTTIVTMSSDKNVTVRFDRIRVLDVPGDFTNIWGAIADANDGDVILIAPGTYSYEPGQHPLGDIITIDRKAITIMGAKPEDPSVVAATIIDGRMVISNVGRDTIINGLTITNSDQTVDWSSPAPPAGPGNDGIRGGDFEGGGMELLLDASPTVINCIFDRCYVWGGDGSNGNSGTDSRGSPGNGGWAGWAYGGAVVVGDSGKPLFKNCTFVDCWARGGDGGNTGDGGHGGNWETELVDGRNWTWDNGPFLPYWKYSGYGGAVYCHPYSAPEFEDCTFENNRAIGGSSGCNTTGSITVHSPLFHYKIDSFGGAVYAAEFSAPSFADCFFTGNEADVNGLDVHHLGDSVPINYDPYISYGGAIAYEDGAKLVLNNCTFNDNAATIGGAIWSNWSDITISDSNFTDNFGYHGGGVYIVGGSTEIGRSNFKQNEALIDANIPSLNNILDPNDLNALVRVLGEGGAIHFFDADAKIYDCNMTRNDAFAGGGLYWSYSNMTISDCNIADSNAYHGAGLYSIDSTGTISGTTVTRNRAVIMPLAVYPTTDPNDPNVTLFDPNISLFGQGGGYYNMSSDVDITNSIFFNNEANGSGGGIYYRGSNINAGFAPLLHNSLLTGNTAGSDGGGVSANWYAGPTISNCTIADNKVTGTTGIGPGYGGGLYCSNGSNVNVIDSIIWGNISAEGAQVAVATGSDKESMPSTISISHSDIGPKSDPNQADPIIAIVASGVDSQQSSGGPQTTGSGKLIDGSSIYRKFDAGQEKAKVIVTLTEPDIRRTTNWDNPQSVSQLRTSLASRRASVLSTLTANEFTTRRTYQNVAAFSGEVSREGLNKLLTHPSVRNIEPMRYDRVMLAQALPQANALEVRQAYSGKGISIAIADTGVDYSHPMLGGTEFFPNTKVIGGYDFGNGDYDPMPRGTAAGINPVMAHGTSCAGIAAGDLGIVGNYIGGVAYDARIYALKLAPDSNDYPPLPRDAEIAAWDWCITHRNDDPLHPIKVISNSWGGGPWTNDPAVADAASPAMTTLADTAVGLGITILASSGNEYSAGQGLAWPSCMSNVISVGATYDAADMILPYSNTDENLDILAPADPVYTTDIVGPGGFSLGDYTPNFNGTSSACPFAAGCVASIQNAALGKIGRYLTPQEVRALLVATGDPITDTKVAITKPRVNLAAAIRSPSGPPIYIEEDCIINDWQAPVTNSYAVWDTAAWDGNVIEEDPNFIVGYYLSQFATGQIIQSNCVDGGSDLASVIGLDTRTTRIDGVNDANIVDMGYHYDRRASKYKLTVTVRENPNDPGIHGTADPNTGWYYEGTELTLTAKPDTGYYLQGWYANGVLISIANELDVVMDSNQVFEIRFRLPRKVEVSGEDISLAQAVNSAQNGDTLVVAAGTYDGDIDFRGKEIKLVSTNPDDPNIIAETIIDCGNAMRAFTFNNGEGPGSMINGFTIVNGGLFADYGGAIYIGSESSPTIVNVTISNCQVTFGSGGAIYVDANSSPTFENVTISNCSTVGISSTIGGGNGGGVYLNTNSSPVFTDCYISGCSTDGSGGAVYSGSYSSAVFNNCIFTGNNANLYGGGIYHASNSTSTFNRCMLDNNEAEDSGGGIYYNINCESKVTDCNFTGNNALGVFTTSFQTDPNDPNTVVTTTDDSPIGMGGGIYCNSDSSITVTRSIFEQNSAEDGGGFYLDAHSVVEVYDCNITGNTATRGGGLFCIDCPDSKIAGCLINNNESVNIVTTFAYFIYDPNNPNIPPVPIEPNDPAFDPNDPNLIVITVEDRSGIAQGGGIYSFAGPTLITDCKINFNNTTTSGGGIYFAGGEHKLTTLRNCLLTNNSAGRDGGGVSNNWQNELRISNCTIAQNAVVDVNSLGGGLYGSYNSNTVVTDSIIWNNVGSRGSQIALGSGDPVHPLPSTLNISYSDIDLSDGFDIAIHRDGSTVDGWIPNYPSGPWDADKFNIAETPYFTAGYYLSQIASGQDLDSPCVDAGSGDANDPDIGISGYTTRTDGVPDENAVDMGYHYPNPLPVNTYHLTVTVVDANGTEITDPNLIHGYVDPNGGSFAQNSVVTLTAIPDPTYRVKAWTGTDDDISRALNNTVTMDANEYVTIEFEPDIYQLTTIVVGGHGTLDPNSGPQFGGVIQLKATPEIGYRIKRWTGTDKDLSWNKTNTVTLDRNKTVSVEFELDVIRVLKVPTEYKTIEEAIIAGGQLGTKIIVDRGIYPITSLRGIDFRGKNITLMSTDPDDPEVIANTIIDCRGARLTNRRAFWFHSGEDQNTKVIGFTIRNGYINGGNGRFGRPGEYMPVLTPFPYELQPDANPDPNQTPPRAERGGDIIGNGYGGGILCENGSSPAIVNCVITNCTVTGAHGGDGAQGQFLFITGMNRGDMPDEWSYIAPTDADPTNVQTSSDGQWGGHAGTGTGYGYGGAIACLSRSCPTITNCTITNNSALGGMGGNGGNGGTTSGGNESGGGYGGDAIGDGIGGGIFSDNQSCPIITDCDFVNNVATTGIPGQGGEVGIGGALDPRARAGSTGFIESNGGIAGGAAYFGNSSDANIINSTFSNNKAYDLSTILYSGLIILTTEPTLTYTRGGALYSTNNNTVVLKDCEFTGNLGGAVYCSSGCTLDVNDCSFKENAEAVEGSAIYLAERVQADIKNTNFSGNSALGDGGAINSDSDADFTDCSFNNNIAGENGGAIEAYLDSEILRFNFNRCSFTRNQASQGVYGWGGGVYFQEFDATFTDCYFINNTAKSGGGLFLSTGKVALNGGVIKGNKSIGGSGINVISNQSLLDVLLSSVASVDFIGSYFDSTTIAENFNTSNGIGGGLACADTEATIENCTLSDNTAEGVNGSGGAINFYGGIVEHSVKNCLLTGNSSADNGGAISSNLFAKPKIQNCTFSNNRTNGMGGAVFSDWSSDATITDSIFQSCTKGAIADGYKDYKNSDGSVNFNNTTVKFCLFYSNSDGNYVIYDPNSEPVTVTTGFELDDTNIKGNPLFVAGPLGNYYLSQKSDPSENSPAIDAGSALAIELGLSDLTTRTDGAGDSDQVDIGYHYRDPGPPKYTLTVRVVNKKGGTINVEPSRSTYHTGMTVKLTATPNAGWQVSKWSGTDNDSSKTTNNTVTILGADAFVEVVFWQPAIINVPGDYQTIQDAVTAANDGDRIVVDTGVYYGGYSSYALLIDKSVYITSSNPHDPNTVAATIIRGNRGVTGWNYIGVVFRFTTDANTVLNGFTIEDFGGNWGDGDDGDRGQGHPNGEDGAPAEGAGIYIEPGASPVIMNCIIRNNFLNAGDGGNGVGADADNNAGRGGWGGWARGAGIYCGPYTNPKLVNCTIEGNIARAGSGGNGGSYASPGGFANYGGNYSREGSTLNPVYNYAPNDISSELVEGHLWEVWEWDFALIYGPLYSQSELTSYIDDYRWYSGYGGGVYCDIGTSVIFDNCEIRSNRTYGGMSGQGGVRGPAGRLQEPIEPYEIPSYGGGVYCAANSTVIFDGCTFEDNIASETEDPANPNHRLSPYIGYGGGVSAERSATIYFADCNFVDNQADSGGGIYVNDVDTTIVDCNIASNTALRGGGFLGIGGLIDIKSSIVANNQAAVDVNDPNDDEVLSIGAGLCVLSVDAIIHDCEISGNQADSSGGGIYLRGENEIRSEIRNCLIINNVAGRDGGGISANWYAMPAIANCTFVGNAASGTEGERGNTGLGGALYCGYDSNVTITDSILWNNYGLKGQEIAIGSGFELDPRCATLAVSYSDIKASLNSVWIDRGCPAITWGPRIINDNPLFVSGPDGDYYLRQAAVVGEWLTSPCVDRGSTYASYVGLLGYTTRTDHVRDKGKVDMGYHYNTEDKCRFADFIFDGVINELDFDKFAQLIGFDNFIKLAEEHWLREPEKPLDLPSSEGDDWRNGADITTDGHVSFDDVEFLMNCNDVTDINAPIPNPSEWYIEPILTTLSSISMAAETAFDVWSRDVKYYFDRIDGDDHDSGWQDDVNYTDWGITPGVVYGYRVRARDRFGNMTEWSEVRYAGIDNVPPAPAPRIDSINAISPTSITMVATIPNDLSGIQYYFQNTRGNGNDSGWQNDPNYTDTSLDPDTEYGYRVKARDTSSNQNETNWSETVRVRTQVSLVPPDRTPPQPDPMEWDPTLDPNGIDGTPHEVYGGGGTWDYYAVMTAVVAVDAGGGPVEYYFECTTVRGFESGWQNSPTYSVPIGRSGQAHFFRVRARDQFGNMTEWSVEDMAD